MTTVFGLGPQMMLTKVDLQKQLAVVFQTKWLQMPMITSALAKIARLVLVKDVTPARSVGHHSMSSDGRALKKCADAHPEKPQRSSLGVKSAPTCTMVTAELTATCARRPLSSMELLSANAMPMRPAKLSGERIYARTLKLTSVETGAKSAVSHGKSQTPKLLLVTLPCADAETGNIFDIRNPS